MFGNRYLLMSSLLIQESIYSKDGRKVRYKLYLSFSEGLYFNITISLCIKKIFEIMIPLLFGSDNDFL